MTQNTGRPVVSVIMPVHAVEPRFLEEAIESLRAQSEPRWELVIVLDSAEAAPARVAREAAGLDPDRIKVVGTEGGAVRGHSVARNLGLAHARAELIGFLDADDVLLPNRFAEQVPLLERHPDVAMLYGRTEYWYSWTGTSTDAPRDHTPALGVPSRAVQNPPHLLCRFLDGGASVPCTCSILVRRSAIEAVGGFEDEFRVIYGDQAFYAKIALEYRILPWDATWDRYRRHPGSITHRSGAVGESLYRRQFLRWLQARADRAGVREAGLSAVVERQLWELDHPVLARLSRIPRRLRNRAIGLCRGRTGGR